MQANIWPIIHFKSCGGRYGVFNIVVLFVSVATHILIHLYEYINIICVRSCSFFRRRI